MKKLSILFLFEGFFSFSQPVITNYREENSPLTFNTVRCIAIQSQTKWFGTDDGLCSFDGQNWETFTSTNSPLIDDDIRALKVENDSTIWIGTMQSGLYKKQHSEWINFNLNNIKFCVNLCTFQ